MTVFTWNVNFVCNSTVQGLVVHFTRTYNQSYRRKKDTGNVPERNHVSVGTIEKHIGVKEKNTPAVSLT